MTREEAIEILKYLIPIPHRGDGKSTRHLLQTNALAMAIKALEQQPVLDKVRAEIDKIYERENHSFDCLDALDELKEFIAKYKAEEREQIPDTRRTRILPPENILKLKEYAEWLPQYEGEWVTESEESMIRSRQMANKLSQNIIEHARRLYPEAIGYKGQLTTEQFCEIEKECDIDFYKFGRQDTIYKIRYKGAIRNEMPISDKSNS